ncbi:MAG: hypothetical protein JWM64_1461, partial [Frankiales bacterium]|nr:hypothetical protein [Frankiales bacterium]
GRAAGARAATDGDAPAAPGAVRPGTAAVRPGQAAPRPPRREPTGEVERPAAGELVCGQCGAGNVASRRFCRRCGNDLVDAVVVPPPSLWYRLRHRSPKPPVEAGARKGPRRRVRVPRGVALLMLLVLGSGGLYALRQPALGLLDPVRDRVQGKELLNPQSFAASSSAKGHPASQLRDGATNKSWAPAGKPGGAWVEARFAAPHRVVGMVVHTGASTDPKTFLANGRPTRFRVTLSTTSGPPVVREVAVKDQPGEQEVSLGVDDVRVVRLTVLQAQGVRPGVPVALGEVEFFGRG